MHKSAAAALFDKSKNGVKPVVNYLFPPVQHAAL